MSDVEDQGKTLKFRTNAKGLSPMSGSKSIEFTHILANQALSTTWSAHSDKEERERQISATIAAFIGVEPQDELEGMLVAQMIAAHNASIECFRRAMLKEQSFEGRNMNLNYANKLSRSYAAMLEALSRYRGKGQQKMTVEHVHVHAGGQAIVGNVSREGGGIASKTEEQPHAKQITHAPVQTMPSPDTQRENLPVPSYA